LTQTVHVTHGGEYQFNFHTCCPSIVCTTHSGCSSVSATDQLKFCLACGSIGSATLECLNGATTLCINCAPSIGCKAALTSRFDCYTTFLGLAPGCYTFVLTQTADTDGFSQNTGSYTAHAFLDPTVSLVGVPELATSAAGLPVALLISTLCVLLERRLRSPLSRQNS
jgi:hypothetical protein